MAGDDDGEDEDVVQVVRGSRSRPVTSANADGDDDADADGNGDDLGADDNGSQPAVRTGPLSVLRKYGSSRVAKAAAAENEEGEGEAMDLDADSVAASGAAPLAEVSASFIGDWDAPTTVCVAGDLHCYFGL